ncbi:exonuclease, RdgC family protein, partial [Vibrio parahaemolyticus V-223/04]
KSL